MLCIGRLERVQPPALRLVTPLALGFDRRSGYSVDGAGSPLRLAHTMLVFTLPCGHLGALYRHLRHKAGREKKVTHVHFFCSLYFRISIRTEPLRCFFVRCSPRANTRKPAASLLRKRYVQ
jgi:hypothetical protein